MTLVRKAVTLDRELAAAAQRIAPGGNFSALVAEALEDRVRSAALRDLMERDRAERGPLDPAVVADVDRQLDDAFGPRREARPR